MTTNELTTDSVNQRHQFARRVVAGSAILLIAATKPLWFSMGEFPQIPFFEFLCGVPQWCDWLLSVALLISLLVMLITKVDSRQNRLAGAGTIALTIVLIALNQHRLQPWAWFLILATLATSADATSALKWMRWLVFGVYFFSGLSKAEPTFVNGGGNWLLDGLLQPFGQNHTMFARETRRLLIYLMPVGEIVAAFCVIVPRLRFVGFFLVLAMHGALLLALGPLGLNHKPGVLLWNFEFQLLAFPLLWNAAHITSQVKTAESKLAGSLVVLGAIVLPCLGQRWLPIVDQWPSWSVYATWARSENPVEVVIRSDSSDVRIPTTAFGFFDYHRVDLDQWSLEATGAPFYPSRRFRFGVARGLLQFTGFKNSMVPMNQFTSADPTAPLVITDSGGRTIDEAASAFALNTKPRVVEPWVLADPPEGEYLQ
ncbi:MAG: hypothetical protein AB8G99_20625 [Planctomycetaceae bacterium]